MIWTIIRLSSVTVVYYWSWFNIKFIFKFNYYNRIKNLLLCVIRPKPLCKSSKWLNWVQYVSQGLPTSSATWLSIFLSSLLQKLIKAIVISAYTRALSQTLLFAITLLELLTWYLRNQTGTNYWHTKAQNNKFCQPWVFWFWLLSMLSNEI